MASVGPLAYHPLFLDLFFMFLPLAAPVRGAPLQCQLRRCSSPLGDLLLLATDEALCGVYFADSAHPRHTLNPAAPTRMALLDVAQTQLNAYFARQLQRFDLPLGLLAGTPFQRRVWQALAQIEHGSHISYGNLAARLGQPTATRAVAAAVGRNPLSIVLPCHRVLGSKGQLTGYSGGLARKQALLQLEAAQ